LKAFILGAGKGKRLRPLTESTPKPLIRIADKTLLQYHLERLKDAGIDEVMVNVSYRMEEFQREQKNLEEQGFRINLSYEEELLGTGGGIGKVIDFFEGEEFVLLSSDVWTEFRLNQLTLDDSFLAHMILVENSELNPGGDVSLVKKVVSPVKKGESFSFGGVALIHPDLFKGQVKDSYDLWERILKPAALKSRVSGQVYEGKHININTVGDLQKIDGYAPEE